jgi:lipopolysaccharide/colanic/teichoic acid biosynthesis glycosyltransferase
MRADIPGLQITSANDPRITAVGPFIRGTKLDELPQLFNVFKGDMSFVGPRPEVPMYVEEFIDDFTVLLSVRPGLTGAASLEFRNESEILSAADDATRCYREEVLPRKIEIEKDYVESRSFVGDLKILARTMRSLLS